MGVLREEVIGVLIGCDNIIVPGVSRCISKDVNGCSCVSSCVGYYVVR